MKFIADLHVHSRYSRATAKNLDLENLYIAAQLKGVTVVGTGDFTYPAWFEEIEEKLVPAETGLFKLKDELARPCDAQVPPSCLGRVRFMLVTEISNIYKKNGRTRKNHNLVFAPNMEVARQFSKRLDKIGNIKSDGRPILGLDARDLLEILLETSEDAFLIPAHIWTPWFSVLGSKSGFDSIEECFEDLTSYIFAVETGLSSDPAMNWRVSSLDRFTLISNSDAHSPLNLGRESNLFNTELSYSAIKSAMKTGDSDQFLGTFEFYPEEGKYHIDGHRACGISFWPATTLKHDGLCPVCGKPLTLGVLYRVEELADRKEDQKPHRRAPYFSIVQLKDILSEIFRVGPNSKKVKQAYQATLDKLGPEFNILQNLDTVAIEQAGISLLPEAVERMRRQEISVIPGYDGQYGRVQIFKDHERAELMGQQSLFALPIPQPAESESIPHRKNIDGSKKIIPDSRIAREKRIKAEVLKASPQSLIIELNDRQHRAVEHPDGRLLIVAGPGTGKTRTLTARIAHLIVNKNVSAESILAVTFTRKAAQEMQQRLHMILGNTSKCPLVATFHSLCFKILNELKTEEMELIVDDDERKAIISEAIKQTRSHGLSVFQKPQKLLDRIIAAKQQILSPDDLTEPNNVTADARMLAEVYHSYQNLLSIQGLNDYEDLIFKVVRMLEADPKICQKYRDQFQHIFIDEYQDLNHGQYRIIKALAPPNASNRNLCVIGDPDQAIYGFRGSDVRYFTRFVDDYPDTAVIRLTRNYRSTETILDASFQVIQNHRLHAADSRTYSEKDGIKTIRILELASAKAEARAIAAVIAQLVGGTGFHSIDTGQVDNANLVSAHSYVDFAVLVRTHQQIPVIAEVFEQAGVPFQIASRQNALKSWGLPELISVLKVVQKHGSDVDVENSLQLFSASMNKRAIDHFKSWCVSNNFSQQNGLAKAKRFPIPGLSRSRQQKIIDFGEQLAGIESQIGDMTVADQLRYLSQIPSLSALVNTDPRSREAFNNLLTLSADYGNSIAEFLASAALDTDTDSYLPRAEKVSLMTMHAAKGLEFPVVFIAGCEKDLIPLNRRGADPADPAEERRLFYVAMTRAMERLYLTRAKKRSVYGQLLSRSPSPFLIDIENRLKKDDTPKTKKKKEKEVCQKQLELF
jgi:DNA helicase-2/ATP-dependent DNA helicase PcrA